MASKGIELAVSQSYPTDPVESYRSAFGRSSGGMPSRPKLEAHPFKAQFPACGLVRKQSASERLQYKLHLTILRFRRDFDSRTGSSMCNHYNQKAEDD